MALPLLALAAAGAFLSAGSQLRQGQAARESANYAAWVSEQDAAAYEKNALRAVENSYRDVDSVRESFVRSEGDFVAQLAANGMDVGGATALAYLAQGARDANIDAETIRMNYADQWSENTRLAKVNRQNAQYQRISGRNAEKNSRLGALASLLTGGAQLGMGLSGLNGGGNLSGGSSSTAHPNMASSWTNEIFYD